MPYPLLVTPSLAALVRSETAVRRGDRQVLWSMLANAAMFAMNLVGFLTLHLPVAAVFCLVGACAAGALLRSHLLSRRVLTELSRAHSQASFAASRDYSSRTGA